MFEDDRVSHLDSVALEECSHIPENLKPPPVPRRLVDFEATG
jgi:hypothetical protein